MSNLEHILSGVYSPDQKFTIIGYEKGTGKKRRPVFVNNVSDFKRLVFDTECQHNLAVYLSKTEIKKTDHVLLFVTPSAMQSVIRLMGENQLAGRNIQYLLLNTEQNPEIISWDQLKQKSQPAPKEKSQETEELYQKLESMNREERFAFWKEQLSACVRCYACRSACPLCYCTRCVVEVNQPQWISVPSTLQGNFEYHITRAMHMAGRCVGCAACEEACPLHIPLNFITRQMAKDIQAAFGSQALSAEDGNVLNTFEPSDSDNFIH